VTESTEATVARRVPSITEERLRVLSRRQPVTVEPGTSLADCVRAIQRTGTGDSVFVCDASGRLVGVLTERDVFARIVGGTIDLQHRDRSHDGRVEGSGVQLASAADGAVHGPTHGARRVSRRQRGRR